LLRLASAYLIRFGGASEWSCDAHDVVHEVFTSLWNRSADLELHGPIDRYLRSAVHRGVAHQCRRRMRERKYSMMQDAPPATGESDSDILIDEQARQIAGAVWRLPRKCRVVFQMYMYDDLAYSEIAERLSISTRTVEAHIRHARAVLKELLTSADCGRGRGRVSKA